MSAASQLARRFPVPTLLALEELQDAWRALDEHDRTAPAVSSVSAAQVREAARVQLRAKLASARSGLDCLLRSDV